MASIKISGLEETTTTSSTDVYAVQGNVGHTKKITLANIANAIKNILGILWKSYNALSYVGCTNSSSLQEIVDAMPLWSELIAWINQTYAVHSEVLTALGLSDKFGYLVVTRYDYTWEVKFVVFNSNETYMCRYSETNDSGWTSWEKQ